jgi:hypothetical protein
MSMRNCMGGARWLVDTLVWVWGQHLATPSVTARPDKVRSGADSRHARRGGGAASLFITGGRLGRPHPQRAASLSETAELDVLVPDVCGS